MAHTRRQPTDILVIATVLFLTLILGMSVWNELVEPIIDGVQRLTQ